jgi:hypothetical protein
MYNQKHIHYCAHQVHMVYDISRFKIKTNLFFSYLDKHDDETVVTNENGKYDLQSRFF